MKKTTQIVVHGDCASFLPANTPKGGFNLIFSDPPFNIGREYENNRDCLPVNEYVKFTHRWLDACKNALADGGVLCVHGPDQLARIVIRRERALGLEPIAWVNLLYSFGQCTRRNWVDARTHCLFYAKGERGTWNHDDVLVESMRSSTYADKRVTQTERGGKRLPGTIWGLKPYDNERWGRVQGTSKERWNVKNGALMDHDNQIPINVVRRIVLAYTNPGDNVCDPFVGSGTTGLVAKHEGRNFVGFDTGKVTAASALKRIKCGWYPESLQPKGSPDDN
ncbi:DNA-methyltransferase [Rosistilla oblonga]|uniref:DNA-methyltransferase n=1 Tax=Rosistilla oblonga TaxID=2527990 RepID=UPI003A96A07B